jgi:hypothetical protein
MCSVAVARSAVYDGDGCVRNEEQAGGIMMPKRQKATFECNENVLIYLQNELLTSVTRDQVCASAETWYFASAITVNRAHETGQVASNDDNARHKRYSGYLERLRGKQSCLQVLRRAVVTVVAKPAGCEHK